jgi:23S rRNA (guanosine2251-2'-O)-methyltransferase
MADVVYGRQAVREALRGRREVGKVWCAHGLQATVDWLPRGAREASPAALAERAGSPDHQGVVAEVSEYPYVRPEELLAGERPLVVALDEVTDPHNLGAVARVAECAGADGLLITARRSARVTPAVCRVSAGAVEHLPVARVENLADLLVAARRPGFWSYAAAADSAVPHDRADYRDGALFVLGSEGRGLRRRVRAVCDQAVAIPMHGCVESLNVSTAAAVLLFEAVRQRRGG